MQQPPDPYQHPKITDIFQNIVWLFMLAVYFAGVFWALLVKKPGTVGTRAYMLDMSGGFVLLLALSQGTRHGDKLLFTSSLVLLALMYLWHLHCTLRSKVHVHTKCVGHSRFPGDGQKPAWLEICSGVVVAIAFGVCGFQPFGTFIFISACANFARDAMIQERDRQRSVQMEDAMWEQQYMMRNYNAWKRGQRNE